MDTAEVTTTEYREFDAETTISKLLGAFQTHRDSGVLVAGDEQTDLASETESLGSVVCRTAGSAVRSDARLVSGRETHSGSRPFRTQTGDFHRR